MASGKKSGGSNSIFLALLGSIFGPIIGFVAIGFLIKDYEHLALLMIPGIVCGILTLPFMSVRNNFFGFWCFLLSFAAGFFSAFYYFNKTKNLNQYISEWQSILPINWGFIALGALIAYFFSRGRNSGGGKSKGGSKNKKEKKSDD